MHRGNFAFVKVGSGGAGGMQGGVGRVGKKSYLLVSLVKASSGALSGRLCVAGAAR